MSSEFSLIHEARAARLPRIAYIDTCPANTRIYNLQYNNMADKLPIHIGRATGAQHLCSHRPNL